MFSTEGHLSVFRFSHRLNEINWTTTPRLLLFSSLHITQCKHTAHTLFATLCVPHTMCATHYVCHTLCVPHYVLVIITSTCRHLRRHRWNVVCDFPASAGREWREIVFLTTPPRRLVINQAFNGHADSNPFNFHQFNLNDIGQLATAYRQTNTTGLRPRTLHKSLRQNVFTFLFDRGCQISA